MRLNPYLTFNGRCEAAFKFYEQCLGGKIVMMMTHAGMPVESQVSREWRDKILHATLQVGDLILQGADLPPEHYQRPQGISVMLALTDTAEAERIFRTLTEMGTVTMPLQETFWAVRFGMLIDQFGIPWMINCGKAAQ